MTDPVKLTIDSAVEIEGREDVAQLTVKGDGTQQQPLQEWQDGTSGHPRPTDQRWPPRDGGSDSRRL